MMLQHPLISTARLLIDDAVLEVVIGNRQLESTDTESGGILLGLRRDDHLHVTGLTTPYPDDKRSRTSFQRKDKAHQARALLAWRDSGGVVDYIGEWHTHPERQPSPSPIDRREWNSICMFQHKPMVFLIAGTLAHLWLGVGDASDIRQAMPTLV